MLFYTLLQDLANNAHFNHDSIMLSDANKEVKNVLLTQNTLSIQKSFSEHGLLANRDRVVQINLKHS